MKKTYIIPELETIEIKAQHQILAGSTLSTDPTPVSPGSTDAPGFVEIDELDILKNF